MVTIYTRKDLIGISETKDVNDINYTDFRMSKDPYIKAEIVVFFDNNGEHKILKNRFADTDPRGHELLNLIGLSH